jgi:porphobilinogen synthase
MYPIARLRRNRRTSCLRELVAETTLSSSNLILPIFVVTGTNQLQEIKSMPNIYRQSIDQVILSARSASLVGIKAIMLFPCVSQKLKTDNAEESYNADNLICNTIKSLKEAKIDISIICDVALDPYTINGHDGIIFNDEIDNDKTIEILCKQAISLARAGADIIAPSDMMDGRIISIRNALDESNFVNINILSYGVKYASGCYGPFRDAVNNRHNHYLDKSTYQMDIRNVKEAMREIETDVEEGADIIMIKPGMMFLDIIREASNHFNIPLFAYQVSGEYAMLKFAAEAGAIEWRATMLESLISFRRAGASSIVTYAAIEFAEILNKKLL